VTLNLQDESRSGSPPDPSTSLAKDALSTHIQKWYIQDKDNFELGETITSEEQDIIKDTTKYFAENMAFYTREELAALGINLLEKE
jgi:hypothetical protein